MPLSRRYDVVLLDIDGTLVDSNDLHAQAWKEALFDRGYYVPFHRIRRLIGQEGTKMLTTLTGIPADSIEGRILLAYRTNVFLGRYLPKVRPFPHIRTLLERMREEDLRLAIASAANEDERAPLLKAAGIEDLLDPTLDIATIDPQREILIGDTSYDIDAGRLAGVDVLAMRCGGAPDGDLVGAIAIYDDPMDLLENFASSPLGARR